MTTGKTNPKMSLFICSAALCSTRWPCVSTSFLTMVHRSGHGALTMDVLKVFGDLTARNQVEDFSLAQPLSHFSTRLPQGPPESVQGSSLWRFLVCFSPALNSQKINLESTASFPTLAGVAAQNVPTATWQRSRRVTLAWLEGTALTSQAVLDTLLVGQLADGEETEGMCAGKRVAVLPCGHVFHKERVKGEAAFELRNDSASVALRHGNWLMLRAHYISIPFKKGPPLSMQYGGYLEARPIPRFNLTRPFNRRPSLTKC